MMRKEDLQFRYFTVEPLPKEPHRKTRDWNVLNKLHGTLLGVIAWYGPWRSYCLHTVGGVVFSTGCLDDIEKAIKFLLLVAQCFLPEKSQINQ